MESWFWILGWILSILTIAGNGFIIFLPQLVFLLHIRWVVIYPMDSGIQRLKNWALIDIAMDIF